MAVSDLISEELLDPATESEVTTDIKVHVLILVVLHPEQGQGGPKADDKELESKDGVEKLVHQAHQI